MCRYSRDELVIRRCSGEKSREVFSFHGFYARNHSETIHLVEIIQIDESTDNELVAVF